MIVVSDGAGRGVLFVFIVVVTVALWSGTGTAAAQSAPDCSTVTYDGAGTEANPYEVGNVDQLQCIEDQGLEANYVQVSDIDASETASWNDDKGFEPIGEFDEDINETEYFLNATKRRDLDTIGDLRGNVTAEFDGQFDGGNHEITELTIDRGNEPAVGIFSVIGSAGTVTNVSVVDADIGGYNGVGGLAWSNEGTVIGAKSSGSVDGSGEVGGLIGSNSGLVDRNVVFGMVSDSHATGEVNGSGIVGGLVGLNAFGGTINESYSTGGVDGSSSVGGLVGGNVMSTVDESYSKGPVNGSERVGGLVGANAGTVEDSYARGDVDGLKKDIGGLVGLHGTPGRRLNATLRWSYATGTVTAPGSVSRVGGLVGNNSNEATVTESYWDVNATGWAVSDGGTGLTTAEMTGSDAFTNMAGFDFANTWFTGANPDDYPILGWELREQGDADRQDGENGSGTESVGDEADGGNRSGGSDDAENNPSSSDDTGTEGLPGFTVVTAALALLIVVAAASRQRTK